MRKVILTVVLGIGMILAAQAQSKHKSNQGVYVIDSNSITLEKVLDHHDTKKGNVHVIKEEIRKEGHDVYLYLTLEDKSVLVFKNNILIGGLK